MFNQLIGMSIGWRMVMEMNDKSYAPFHAGLLSQTDNRSSVIVSNCEAFFDTINIFGIRTFEGWEVFLTIVFNIILLAFIVNYYKRVPEAGWKENVLIYLNIGLINLYCCNISKESWQIVFYFLMAWSIIYFKGYRKKTTALAIVLLLTVLYTRKYYALVGLYFFILQFLVRQYFDNIDISTNVGRKLMVYRVLMLFALFGIFHYFFLGYLAEESEDTYEEMVMANTRESQISDSAILPIFTGNQVALALDYFIKIIRLSFPVELLLKGKVTYIFMIANQFLLFYFIIKAFVKRNELSYEEAVEEGYIEDEDEELRTKTKNENKIADEDEEELRTQTENKNKIADEDEEELRTQTENKNKIADEDEEEEDEDDEEEIEFETQDRKDTRTAALYLYLAFLLCSAAFEPDFGSWSRHLGCAFPFTLTML